MYFKIAGDEPSAKFLEREMRCRLSLRLSSSGIAFGENDSNVLSALQIALSVVFGFLEEIGAVLTKLIQRSQRSRYDTGSIKTLGTRARYLNSILCVLIFDSHSEELLISLCVVFGRFLLGRVIEAWIIDGYSTNSLLWRNYSDTTISDPKQVVISSMIILPLDK